MTLDEQFDAVAEYRAVFQAAQACGNILSICMDYARHVGGATFVVHRTCGLFPVFRDLYPERAEVCGGDLVVIPSDTVEAAVDLLEHLKLDRIVAEVRRIEHDGDTPLVTLYGGWKCVASRGRKTDGGA